MLLLDSRAHHSASLGNLRPTRDVADEDLADLSISHHCLYACWTIVFPGFDGGGEWGGAAFDPASGLLYVNANEMAWILRLVERPSAGSLPGGHGLYLKHCATCHGKNGHGDGPGVVDLGIQPSKLCDPRLRADPDGALFWKITVGKKPMPGYGRRLSETDRWNLINYLRTLAASQ